MRWTPEASKVVGSEPVDRVEIDASGNDLLVSIGSLNCNLNSGLWRPFTSYATTATAAAAGPWR